MRASLITSVSTKYTSGPAVDLLAREVRVSPYIWHASEHVGERFPLGTLKSGLQDLTVLLLGTTVALGGSLL
jgi:hypothetical protein